MSTPNDVFLNAVILSDERSEESKDPYSRLSSHARVSPDGTTSMCHPERSARRICGRAVEGPAVSSRRDEGARLQAGVPADASSGRANLQVRVPAIGNLSSRAGFSPRGICFSSRGKALTAFLCALVCCLLLLTTLAPAQQLPGTKSRRRRFRPSLRQNRLACNSRTAWSSSCSPTTSFR